MEHTQETPDTPSTPSTPSDEHPTLTQPLWLPRGSVRAVIALGMIAVWAALETGLVGIPASDAVRSIAVGVAAGYGILRSREQRTGGAE